MLKSFWIELVLELDIFQLSRVIIFENYFRLSTAMPAVAKDGMRGLAVFISDIRNCKSKEVFFFLSFFSLFLITLQYRPKPNESIKNWPIFGASSRNGGLLQCGYVLFFGGFSKT